MKHNAEKAIALVEQAVRLLGTDFALQTARSHLLAGVKALSHVQEKRQKRENFLRQPQKIFLPPEEVKKRIQALDDMLKQEVKRQSGSPGSESP